MPDPDSAGPRSQELRPRGRRRWVPRVFLPVALAIALAGCGVPAILASAAPHEYLACTSPVDGCTDGSQMLARPSTMLLSGDGSLSVTAITWHGWGTHTATGRGTAHADSCQPNCAQGTYHQHPATIVLSAPEPWHGKLAYTHAAGAVPSIGWHETITHGLLPSASSPDPSPAFTPPPAPGPVSTQATVTSSCVMGFIPTGQGAVFVTGAPQGQTISGTYYPPVPGYQLTITDNAAATADVAGFAVVFYDSAGTELGSDKENVTEQFITAGQSLTWTEYLVPPLSRHSTADRSRTNAS